MIRNRNEEQKLTVVREKDSEEIQDEEEENTFYASK